MRHREARNRQSDAGQWSTGSQGASASIQELGSRLATSEVQRKPAKASLRKTPLAHLHKLICSIWLQQVLDCMERSAQQQELPAPHLKGRLPNTSLPQNNLQARQKHTAWQAADWVV